MKENKEFQASETDYLEAIDTEFLKNLKSKCANIDADFDKRVKDRLTEIDAVGDTIKILNSDESFEAFDKQEAPVFLQTASTSSQELRKKAVSALRRAASVSGSPQVALLATSAQLD